MLRVCDIGFDSLGFSQSTRKFHHRSRDCGNRLCDYQLENDRYVHVPIYTFRVNQTYSYSHGLHLNSINDNLQSVVQ